MAPSNEHVFTVRLWWEQSRDEAKDEHWRGRLYHSQSKTTRHFVGLAMLFDQIRELLEREDRQ
ncbi:hypothetical protein [Bradyrhizobium sp. USDA 3397]